MANNMSDYLEKFKDFPDHQTILTKALEHLSEDERIVGLYLSGSFARAKPDVYSDIDLYLVIQDEMRDQLVKEHQSIFGKIGKIATIFPATHLGDPNQIIVFYKAKYPIHVDFQYQAVSELKPTARHKDDLIIVDRKGLLKNWKEKSQSLLDQSIPSIDDLQYMEDRFWGWCWYTHSKIQRGELWEAREAIEYLRNVVLLKLVHYLTRMSFEGNRRIENKFSKEIQKTLHSTIPNSHSNTSYHQVLLTMMNVYEKLFKDIISTHHIANLQIRDRSSFINAIRS